MSPAPPPTVVVATAGHVDHGKSALVRALTGSEPDRWDEERRRGLTIDLGYAWATLEDGVTLSFVDVPGHQRFIGNMLAGIGPTAAVAFIVAADEGWRAQSEEHLLAVDALGIEHGILVVTRSDLADPGPALAEASERMSSTSLGAVEAVAVSARTGAGLDELRATFSRLAHRLPAPRRDGRARLWLDRAFTIRGSGTVVTGTLGEGTLETDAAVSLRRAGAEAPERARIRGLHSLDRSLASVAATARTAVNLPSVPAGSLHRGDVLLTGDWPACGELDARLVGAESDQLPGELMLHLGTWAGQVRVRPLGPDAVRLRLPHPLPLTTGDRGILRDPGRQHIVAGIEVVDIDPPVLRRRGAAVRRGRQVAGLSTAGEQRLLDEVGRRGAVEVAELDRLGIPTAGEPVPGVRRRDEWFIADEQWQDWVGAVRELLSAQESRDPLEPSLTEDAAARAIGLPRRGWLADIAADAGAQVTAGRVQRCGARPDLGPAEAGLRAIEERLRAYPFAAPEQDDLDAAGLGPRELAAAVRLGRVLRLPGEVVLLPDGPARAMRALASLPQPFTASEARQALATTRRVVIPLLEHLDSRGWTRRVDGQRREIIR